MNETPLSYEQRLQIAVDLLAHQLAPDHQPRLESAVRLVHEQAVTLDGVGNALVMGDHDTPYVVHPDTGCACPDATHREPHRCKHALAVLLVKALVSGAPPLLPAPKTPPAAGLPAALREEARVSAASAAPVVTVTRSSGALPPLSEGTVHVVAGTVSYAVTLRDADDAALLRRMRDVVQQLQTP